MLRFTLRSASPMHSDILTRRIFASPAGLPLPSPRETHFWYMVPNEVKDLSLLKQYQELLSPCERRSILSMKDDKFQKHALLSRVLMRTTVARYTDCKMTPRSLKFRKNRFGKPEVEWQNDDNWAPPSLHFNISHTSSLIACGVTLDVPIGIDIEEKERKPKNSISSFVRRYFSPSEVQFLNAFSDPECQRREFVKLWTLKEAYVKALGRGFAAAPFKDFTIRYEASKGGEQILSDLETGECYTPFPEEIASNIAVDVSDSENLTSNWQFTLFELDKTHYAAVCVEMDNNIEGGGSDERRLKLWKTIPLVEDQHVSRALLVPVALNCCHSHQPLGFAWSTHIGDFLFSTR